MTKNNIPKLPVPPASWKLDRAGARSTSQPESAAQAMQALDRLESEIAQAPADRGLWGARFPSRSALPRPTPSAPADLRLHRYHSWINDKSEIILG
jgi:hypothetical protein